MRVALLPHHHPCVQHAPHQTCLPTSVSTCCNKDCTPDRASAPRHGISPKSPFKETFPRSRPQENFPRENKGPPHPPLRKRGVRCMPYMPWICHWCHSFVQSFSQGKTGHAVRVLHLDHSCVQVLPLQVCTPCHHLLQTAVNLKGVGDGREGAEGLVGVWVRGARGWGAMPRSP